MDGSVWVWILLVGLNLAFLWWIYRQVTSRDRRHKAQYERCITDAEGKKKDDKTTA